MDPSDGKKELILLVLAAGLGSRYGGLKQLDSFGPEGEALLEYGCFDAIRFGFTKLVFIIRKDFEEEFKSRMVRRMERYIKVELVFQDTTMQPTGFSIKRTTPWGTGHAIWCAREVLDGPFLVMNADDFYGTRSFKVMGDILSSADETKGNFFMYGYQLRDTVSEHGAVSRAICEFLNETKHTLESDEDIKRQANNTQGHETNYVTKLTETKNIYYSPENNGRIYSITKTMLGDEETRELSGSEIISMNMFGLTPMFFSHLTESFSGFLTEYKDTIEKLEADCADDSIILMAKKREFSLPTIINEMVGCGECTLKVVGIRDEFPLRYQKLNNKWFGVTYISDKDETKREIGNLVDNHVYPRGLWNEDRNSANPNQYKVINKFNISSQATEIEHYGNGHINDTFKVMTLAGDEYIMQRINTNIFSEPVKLMNNILNVVLYIKMNNKKAGSGELSDTKEVESVLEPIAVKGGKSLKDVTDIETAGGHTDFMYVDDRGSYWRVFEYVHNSLSYETAETTEMAFEAGRKYGGFLSVLGGMPNVDKLNIVLPNFHNVLCRLDLFDESVREDVVGRVAKCQPEIKFVEEMKGKIVEYYNQMMDEAIPTRVTHNDTKINNVLFDRDTKKGLCVIDLDTIMPGKIFFDYGDSLRTIASSSLEDEKDLDKVFFDIELFKSFTKGFMTEVKSCLTDAEKELLPFAPIYMCYLIGLRFLTDYIKGDTYFKTAYPEHNLVRSRTQIKLVQSIIERYSEVVSFIKSILC